jgi:hypothetical protein
VDTTWTRRVTSSGLLPETGALYSFSSDLILAKPTFFDLRTSEWNLQMKERWRCMSAAGIPKISVAFKTTLLAFSIPLATFFCWTFSSCLMPTPCLPAPAPQYEAIITQNSAAAWLKILSINALMSASTMGRGCSGSSPRNDAITSATPKIHERHGA